MAWKVLTSAITRGKPRVPPGSRIYAVGDVHGRADLLSNIFGRIDEDLDTRPNENAVQVFLGDYVDRGPHSRQVIDLLLERRRVYQLRCLRGNHEDCVLRFLDDPSVFPEWNGIGGGATALSYGVKPPRRDDVCSQREVAIALYRAMPESHRNFFQSLTLSFTWGDFFFAHAGIRPGIPFENQSQQDLLWIREDFLWHEEDFGKVVVHGHTPAKEPEFAETALILIPEPTRLAV